ncbi:MULTISPECIES: response regulator transcription factor [Actinoplanes]|uniref:helix-turn-helix transcriptional regulator n=1 Tax=Actinoplanes TaxID=1865 RepID=UPI0005F2F55D|nr:MULTISPECIES: response regulator transcription factor [Actinoplanes]GLY03851.1 helix-turn-helix transcriptional regulator [Actinoplanes sp. NBRC 101535]
MKRISVSIQAADKLAKAGLVSYLRRMPHVDLVDDPKPGPRPQGVVTTVLAERLDDQAVRQLRELSDRHQRKTLLIVGPLRPVELIQVMECGIRILIWRHKLTVEVLARGLQAADSGESELPPDAVDLLAALVGQPRSPGTGQRMFGVTPREADVLRLLSDGQEIRAIAEKLAYSERTVKTVLHQLINRLELRNRTHAVAYAIREGYI